MEKRQIKEIIWDADNTLWNWVRYAAEAYQAAANIIAEETGIPEPQVVTGMKRFYNSMGTLEHAGLIQGMEAEGFFKGVKSYDRLSLISKVKQSFYQKRKDHLKSFSGIGEILKKTAEKGIKNIIVSDAPAFHASMRLKRSKLEKYIKKLYALKNPNVDELDLPEEIKENIRNGVYNVAFDVEELEVEKPYTKPERVLQREKDEHSERYIRNHVAIAGDNPQKDMALAIKWGCLGIFAAYGKASDEDLHVLRKFAPDHIVAKNTNMDASEILTSPNIVIAQVVEDYYEILDLAA